MANHTMEYLQSDAAEAGIEMGVLVNCILLDAINAKASDVHIEPWESTLACETTLKKSLRVISVDQL